MEYPSREAVPTQYTWDIESIYPSIEEWRAHLKRLESELPKIGEFQGRLGESAQTLLSAFECYYQTLRGLEKLYVYAHLRSDQDTSNAENLGYNDQASNLYARFAAAASFFTPELLQIDPARLDSLLADESLAPYRRVIRETVRYRPHTLSESEEKLLAQGSEVFSTCSKIFSQLNNADLHFGEIEIDGEKRPLTHGNFILYLKNPDRAVRRSAWEQYYGTFDAHRNTIAATLSGSIRKDVFLARAKNYQSAREASLFDDNVPTSVYDNLIATVHEELPKFHRYLALRKKLLKLPDQAPYDLYLPLASDVEIHHTFENAAEALTKAFEPLGADYCSVLHEGLTKKRWVDVFENKGKRSGAYSSGCFDSEPFMLMNYKEQELGDLFTLAHEAGHSMHSYYSCKHQPYQDHGYAIFVAEVASTLNEQLLLSFLRKKYASDPKVLRYLLSHQLDEIRSTLIRQTMFAEFEKLTHQQIEANNPLTTNEYKEIYGSLLQKYFGTEVQIPELQWLECLRIPHFYGAFYVYKYATGISAAIALSDDILSGKPGAVERYRAFLSAGSTKHPIDLLIDAGVDMNSPEPIRKALGVFERLTDELEKLS